jgi:hypothetical protein
VIGVNADVELSASLVAVGLPRQGEPGRERPVATGPVQARQVMMQRLARQGVQPIEQVLGQQTQRRVEDRDDLPAALLVVTDPENVESLAREPTEPGTRAEEHAGRASFERVSLDQLQARMNDPVSSRHQKPGKGST